MGNILVSPKGYLVLFSTETSNNLEIGSNEIDESNLYSKNLALVRILTNFPKKESKTTNANIDPSWKGEIHEVNQQGNEVKNKGLNWITRYGKKENLDVIKSRMVLLPDDTILIYWKTNVMQYLALYSNDGKEIKKPKPIPIQEENFFIEDFHPLFDKNGKAIGGAWVELKDAPEVEKTKKKILINFIGKDLTLKQIEVKP